MKRKRSRDTSTDTNFLRRINRVHVPAADMLDIAQQVGMLEPGKQHFEGLAFLAARHFSGEPELAIAAVFRIEALVRTVVSGKLPGWARPVQPDGSVDTHHALLAAAGEVPLTLKSNNVVFARSTLLRRAFQLHRGLK